MNQPAQLVNQPAYADDTPVCYEQPLGERMRTYLRLEYLYKQLRVHIERESSWATRTAVTSLLDIIAILSRSDLRGESLKELERQIQVFDGYHNVPNADESKVQGVLHNLQALRQELIAIGPQYLSSVRENEFLNAIRHRSSIPGGTCEFDLPDYSFWLRRSHDYRVHDIGEWMKNLRPVCDAVAQLMWLLRNSGQSLSQVAPRGVFQYTMGRDVTAGLLRVSMIPGTGVFPEISGSHHRFTIRFMTWSEDKSRATQANDDINFDLTIC